MAIDFEKAAKMPPYRDAAPLEDAELDWPLTDATLERLEKAALKANVGIWHRRDWDFMNGSDIAYMTSMNPVIARRLVAEVRRLREIERHAQWAWDETKRVIADTSAKGMDDDDD